jgi:four helix bundle protein
VFGGLGASEFAQFLSIARGSVFELSDHLRDGVQRGYWPEESIADVKSSCNRTIAALTHSIHYLRKHPDI